MARPIKLGLDYYPKNTDVFEDRKIRKLLKEFGSKGYLVYDYLICVIYRDKGYYVEHDGEMAFDIADKLGCGINEDLVKEIVNGCIRYGLFNKRLFESSNILTSSGIQSRYVLIKKTKVIDERIRVLDEETPVNYSKSTQRKVKKSKENADGINSEEMKMKDLRIESCRLARDSIGFQVIESAIKLYQGFRKEFPLNRDLPLMEVKDWISPVRELMEKKGYTYEQIADVLNFAVKDKFWRTVILNTQALEKHFETIKVKYQQTA